MQKAALAQAPKWLGSDIFAIDARAEGNPTKDQMRLMMQSLLAERFKLAIHFETRVVRVLELRLVKPGQTGPKMRPHAEGPPCPESFTMPSFPMQRPPAAREPGEAFPRNCGTDQSTRGKNGMFLVGYRDGSMTQIADSIYSYGFLAGDVDKPVIDKTGLDGRFDFTIEYARGANGLLVRSRPPGSDAEPADEQGPPFLSALREQLGMKLVPSKGPVRMLVIDHVERPSGN